MGDSWQVRTPSIAGPLQGIKVPWQAMFFIMGVGVAVFFTLKAGDTKAALMAGFGSSILLYVLCLYRTRQDRDWLTIYVEWVKVRIRLAALYMHRRYYFKWPV